MIIGTLQLELYFSEPQSLKEKRVLLKSLVDRIRRRFNVSVSEIDGMDLWQKTTLAVAAVGNQTRYVNQILDRIAEFIRNENKLEIVKQELEFF